MLAEISELMVSYLGFGLSPWLVMTVLFSIVYLLIKAMRNWPIS